VDDAATDDLDGTGTVSRCAILKGGFIKGQWTKEVGLYSSNSSFHNFPIQLFF
jgi:hypothetical protein